MYAKVKPPPLALCMCGIGAVVGCVSPDLCDAVASAIGPRGPDLQGSRAYSPAECPGVTLLSSVLHIRTEAPFPQPVSLSLSPGSTDATSDCSPTLHGVYNGEIYTQDGADIGQDVCDTALVLTHLRALLTRHHPSMGDTEGWGAVARGLSSLEGPFALIVLDESTQQLICVRDHLGRRSLTHWIQ
ncbi:hypothetical protein KIPB_006282, partial [Kipferlia bialata]|eukprot:g6282.t1